ncbi:hypothetical protein JVU11DRAFT_9189 [Chiua virens]|nr:hypothetical protein JVU11DRAFT_9189 [Chiua virens]
MSTQSRVTVGYLLRDSTVMRRQHRHSKGSITDQSAPWNDESTKPSSSKTLTTSMKYSLIHARRETTSHRRCVKITHITPSSSKSHIAEHRVRQIEEWLAVAVESFRLHQEGLISRIPKLVREVTMGDFADKYNGDIQACLRGIQSEQMGETEFEIDRDTRKRKWAATQEEVEASGSGSGQA